MVALSPTGRLALVYPAPDWGRDAARSDDLVQWAVAAVDSAVGDITSGQAARWAGAERYRGHEVQLVSDYPVPDFADHFCDLKRPLGPNEVLTATDLRLQKQLEAVLAGKPRVDRMATRASVLVEALDHLEHQLSERGFVRQDETRWRRSEPLAPLATDIDLYLEGTRTKPWISPDITLAYPLAPLEPLLDEAVASWWSIDGEAFVADLSPESWPGTYEGLHTGLPLIAVNEFWPSGADLLDDMVVRTLDECAAPILQRITTVDGLMAHALTPDRHGWFRTRPWASALVVTRAHGRDELVGQALAPVLRGEAGRLPKDFQPERLHHFVDWVGTLDPADLRTRLSIEL